MIKSIRIICDIPNVAPAGEIDIPHGIIDEGFAAALVRNGLAEIVSTAPQPAQPKAKSRKNKAGERKCKD